MSEYNKLLTSSMTNYSLVYKPFLAVKFTVPTHYVRLQFELIFANTVADTHI